MIDTDILRDILGDHPLCSVQRAELEKAISAIESAPDWTPCADGMPLKCGDCVRDKGNCIFCAREKGDLYKKPTLPEPYNPTRRMRERWNKMSRPQFASVAE